MRDWILNGMEWLCMQGVCEVPGGFMQWCRQAGVAGWMIDPPSRLGRGSVRSVTVGHKRRWQAGMVMQACSGVAMCGSFKVPVCHCHLFHLPGSTASQSRARRNTTWRHGVCVVAGGGMVLVCSWSWSPLPHCPPLG